MWEFSYKSIIFRIPFKSTILLKYEVIINKCKDKTTDPKYKQHTRKFLIEEEKY